VAGIGDFHCECERCGKVVYYEDMRCLADSWYCRECYEEIVMKSTKKESRSVIWLEDDGYCD
jgi:late competence protein required for DNA uptake (superfamily II DNA/RNA helicase)